MSGINQLCKVAGTAGNDNNWKRRAGGLDNETGVLLISIVLLDPKLNAEKMWLWYN